LLLSIICFSFVLLSSTKGVIFSLDIFKEANDVITRDGYRNVNIKSNDSTEHSNAVNIKPSNNSGKSNVKNIKPNDSHDKGNVLNIKPAHTSGQSRVVNFKRNRFDVHVSIAISSNNVICFFEYSTSPLIFIDCQIYFEN
jgi:hypothetical protein